MDINEVVVAIPSHRRADILQANTLAYLDRCGFPRDRIYVFVSDNQDYDDYECIHGIRIVNCIEAKNLKDKFNHIRRWFPEGKRLFVMEDDVQKIVEKTNENKSRDLVKFHEFLREGFELMDACRARIWGISPHSNAFYMTNDNSIGFKFIVAHAFGMVADSDPRRDITLDGKSDYERTILYYLADGKTPRLNRFGVKAVNSYTGKGGLQAEMPHAERVKKEHAAVRYLITRYALLCAENKTKESVMPEIKLRTIRTPHALVLQQHLKLERALGYNL